jgi:hypothetical protein
VSLALLPPFAHARKQWSSITTGDSLFRHLLVDGKSWEISSDREWLESDSSPTGRLPRVAHFWKKHVEQLAGGEQHATERWTVLAQMLWCFDEARRSENVAPSALDRVALARRLPAFGPDGIVPFSGDPIARPAEVARAYTWIRSFRAIEPTARAHVPIALYDTEEKRGFLATLTLELLPGGIGEVADHPGSAFDTELHDLFVDSIARAWRMASEATPEAPPMDGRWHVRRGPPFTPASSRGLRLVDGASAGGAAARGWWHVLRNQIPDAEIVVLAQVAADGRSLEPVNFVGPKVEAIVREGVRPDGQPAFDTIVVVGDDARREAEDVLGSNGQRIRVVRLD